MMGHKLNIYTNRSVTRTYVLLSFSESKMTLAELKSLVETMQNLPCVMNQLEDVQVRSCLTEQTSLYFCPIFPCKFDLLYCIKSIKVFVLFSAFTFYLCTV